MKNDFLDKAVVVIGLGQTGLSVLRWLNRQGASVTMVDSRTNPPSLKVLAKEWPDIQVVTGQLEEAVLTQAELIVVSPGVSVQEPAIQAAKVAGVEVIGDVELFARYRPAKSKVIAITGSNGKTTVTTLAGEICKEAGLKTVVAGNIGTPVLDTLMLETPDVYVLELSSFQLETISSLKVDVATILNVTQDHLDRYESFEDYAKAKGRIYLNASLSVANRDDVIVKSLTTTESISFGLDKAPNIADFGIDEDGWLTSGRRRLIHQKDLKVQGKHNVANMLAAAALCMNIGIERHVITRALKAFTGLPHRVQWVAQVNGVDYFDDSKGTNVGAACAAIEGLPQKVVLIAGGDGKGQDFSPLTKAVKENARAVVLFGQDARLIQDVLLETDLPIYDAVDLPEAVAIADKVASKGDAVLLSPACASLDMFDNYEHRADVFIKAVKAIEEAVVC